MSRRIVPRSPRKSKAQRALEAALENRQRAVARKISRNKVERDVHIKESGLDPRMPLAEARKLPADQLREYVKKLSAFTSKENQFLRGARGSAIPEARMRELEALDAAFNSLSEHHDATVENLKIPTLGRTVGQRRSDLEKGKDGKRRIDRARGGRRTFDEIHHRAKDIENFNGGLDKLIEQARQKLEPGYISKEMSSARDVLTEMFTVSGDTEFLERVNQLDDMQLDVLINETDFMRNAAARYKAGISGNLQAAKVSSEEFENAGSNIDVLIDWAGKLTQDDSGNVIVAPEPENPATPGQRTTRSRRSPKGSRK